MPRPDQASLRSLRRLQALVRKPAAGGPNLMTRRLSSGKFVAFTRDVADAVDSGASQLVSDLCFEHLTDPKSELWRFVEACWSDRRANHVGAFVTEHAMEPEVTACRVAVDHLRVESPQEVLGARILPFNRELVTDEEWPPTGRGTGSFVEVQVEGTNRRLMAERARLEVERLLRVMRVAIQDQNRATPVQLRFQCGDLHIFGNGDKVWMAPGKGASSLTLREGDIAAVHEHPVASLRRAPSNDVEHKADVALRWMERASFVDEPLVGLLYLFLLLKRCLATRRNG